MWWDECGEVWEEGPVILAVDNRPLRIFYSFTGGMR
ncbi:hypothetical protein J2Y45_002585 [Dyadobacter sp. BE34]|uniref:Uncharacterized protein n=1 Tax=Dyadobacter fermentans TaxID=94254 RepID=A0ABU1QVC2_9BACT|nr:hypothetical protein [Dyadobacter fermentans]MDR7043134.1 hypothetical protein [Dyadobacter sp. BE242]MDR7197446.1 hypothetical protein [Dyadobacter sp. BE34]MDR7215121.1 hypothetical protein [Dyadobacter sp. BE31]MDR7262656.1 hypothetical protein [Dyadobacter sp. BE32]